MRKEFETEDLVRTSPVSFLPPSTSDAILRGAAKNYEQFSVLCATVTRYLEGRRFLPRGRHVHLGLTTSVGLVRHCDFEPLMSALPRPETRPGR